MAILVCLGGLGAFALRAEWQPGLKVGKVAGSANWTDRPAETNTTLRLDATEKAENRGAYAFWAENVTYVYWGQMYFQEGVYHFGEYMDDSAWVEIDGKRCPVIGQIGMLHAAVDIGNLECRAGDRAVLQVNPLHVKGMKIQYR